MIRLQLFIKINMQSYRVKKNPQKLTPDLRPTPTRGKNILPIVTPWPNCHNFHSIACSSSCFRSGSQTGVLSQQSSCSQRPCFWWDFCSHSWWTFSPFPLEKTVSSEKYHFYYEGDLLPALVIKQLNTFIIRFHNCFVFFGREGVGQIKDRGKDIRKIMYVVYMFSVICTWTKLRIGFFVQSLV